MKKNIQSIPLGDGRYCVVTTDVVETGRTLHSVRDELADETERHLYTHLSAVDYGEVSPDEFVERLRSAGDADASEFDATPEAENLRQAERAYGVALAEAVEWWVDRFNLRRPAE